MLQSWESTEFHNDISPFHSPYKSMKWDYVFMVNPNGMYSHSSFIRHTEYDNVIFVQHWYNPRHRWRGKWAYLQRVEKITSRDKCITLCKFATLSWKGRVLIKCALRCLEERRWTKQNIDRTRINIKYACSLFTF